MFCGYRPTQRARHQDCCAGGIEHQLEISAPGYEISGGGRLAAVFCESERQLAEILKHSRSWCEAGRSVLRTKLGLSNNADDEHQQDRGNCNQATAWSETFDSGGSHRLTHPAKSLKQSRLDEIELLDEAELAEAAGGSIAALNVDA